jgi:hypothetical protein
MANMKTHFTYLVLLITCQSIYSKDINGVLHNYFLTKYSGASDFKVERYGVHSASLILEFKNDTGESYYRSFSIDQTSVISGDINNDGINDYAVKVEQSELGSTLFLIQWLLIVSKEDSFEVYETDISGSKMSSIESVKHINNGVLCTEVYELKEDAFIHEKSFSEAKKYRFEKGKLIEIF